MTRLKAVAIRPPQTLEQATELLGRYAQLCADLDQVNAQRAEEIAATNASADALAVPIVADLKHIVKQLKPWWEVSCEALTGGKRKSIELAGCQIGIRTSPPKVTYSGGTDKVAVDALRTSPVWDLVIRVKCELDKPAILRILESEDPLPVEDAEVDDDAVDPAPTSKEQLKALGFGTKQTDEFFVDRVGPASLNVVIAEDLDAAPAA